MTIFTKIKAKTALAISIPIIFRASYLCTKNRFGDSARMMHKVYDVYRWFGFSDKFASSVVKSAYTNAIDRLVKNNARLACKWYFAHMAYISTYCKGMD